MYTKYRHELRHARKAWPGSIVDPCLLSGRDHRDPQTREYIDWKWPISCVHSAMMVFVAQLAEGGGARPPPFTLSTPSTRVTSPPPRSPQQD
jgi:hypothetical protein